MIVLELKSLARDRGLENYARMRKAEFVGFLTIGFELLYAVQGKSPSGAKARTSDKTCVISQFVVGE